jgi:hypothetical protein
MLPHCKSFVPRGIVDIDRGIVDFDQGIVDVERGMDDVERGMDDVERGMDDVERGIDDVGQARFVPQRTRNTGSTAGRESSCGACLPDAATSQLLGSKPLPYFKFSPMGERGEASQRLPRHPLSPA